LQSWKCLVLTVSTFLIVAPTRQKKVPKQSKKMVYTKKIEVINGRKDNKEILTFIDQGWEKKSSIKKGGALWQIDVSQEISSVCYLYFTYSPAAVSNPQKSVLRKTHSAVTWNNGLHGWSWINIVCSGYEKEMSQTF